MNTAATSLKQERFASISEISSQIPDCVVSFAKILAPVLFLMILPSFNHLF